eukprot:gene18748-26524_t
MAIEIKTGDRTVGTENKTTKEIRAVLKERLELVIKLMPLVLPKLAPEPIEKPKEPIQQFEGTILKGNGQPYEDNEDDCQ